MIMPDGEAGIITTGVDPGEDMDGDTILTAIGEVFRGTCRLATCPEWLTTRTSTNTTSIDMEDSIRIGKNKQLRLIISYSNE